MANVFDTIPVDTPTGNVFDTIPVDEPKKGKGEDGVATVRNPFTGKESPIPIIGPDLRKTALGAFLTSGAAEIPAVAAGTAAFGAAAGNPTVQSLPPIGRIGIPLVAGAIGGIAGSMGSRPTMEKVLPELTNLEQEFPMASAAGSNLAQLPFFKVGAGARLAERGLGAAIGGGVQGGTELVNDAPLDRDALIRTAMAAAGGAAFTDPTKLGGKVMQAGAAVNKNPITSKLGNASTKDNLPENIAATTDIAMAPVSGPEVFTPEVNPLSIPSRKVSGAGMDVGAGLREDDVSFLPGPRKNPALAPDTPPERPSRVRGVDTSVEATPDTDTAVAGEFQAKVQEAYNKQVADITTNLKNEGVEVDRQTAVKLANLAGKPEEFNAARQQLIDSVKSTQVEVPKKGPIKSLEELPGKLGQDEVTMPEPAEETHTATVVKSKPAPQKLDFVGVQEGLPEAGIKDVELWNISKDIVDPSGKVLHPKGSTMARETLEGYGIKVPEAPKKAVSEPIKVPEPVKAPETPIVEQKPVKPTEQAPVAKPASPLKPEVIESPLLKVPSKPKRVSVEDADAIDAMAAAQAGKPAPTPEEPKVSAEPIVKKAKNFDLTGTYEVTIGKKKFKMFRDPEQGWWYREGPGHYTERVISTENKEGAIESLKAIAAGEGPDITTRGKPKGGVQKAGEAGIIYNPFETGTEGRRLSQLNRIDFAAHGDGTYSVEGYSSSGVRSNKPAKYGKFETPQIKFRGTEEELRQAFGDAVSDKIIREANKELFNATYETGENISNSPDEIGSSGRKGDIIATGRVEGLNSADFKSKFGTEAGSVLNPFDGEPSALGKKVLDTANESLLKRMAKADVEASHEGSVFDEFLGKNASPEEPSKPASQEPELKLKRRKPVESDLLPTKDKDGKAIPENEAKNAKAIHDKITQDAAKNNAAAPDEKFSRTIAKLPEQYVPFFTDLASRMPVAMGNPVMKPISERIGKMAEFVREKIGLSEDNIGDVYTPAKGMLYERDHFIGRLTNRLVAETKPLGEEVQKSFSRDEYRKYMAATLSGNEDAVRSLFKGKSNEAELNAAYDRNQEAKAAGRQMLIEAGHDVGQVDAYFQRIVVDRDGLRKALGKDGANLWDDALKQARQEKGKPLTDDEETKLMNQLVLSSYRKGTGPSFLKGRKIENVTEELTKFYETPEAADLRWSMGVGNDVGNRRYFGKIKPDEDGIFSEDSSFGRVIKEGVESGAIRDRGLRIIKENLTDLYNNNQLHSNASVKLAGAWRQMQTFAYLADVATGLVQFADMASITREYGKYAAQAYGKNMPKIQDLGVTEGHNVDVQMLTKKNKVNQSYLDKAGDVAVAPYRWAMKNLIGKADELQKSASTRAAMKAVAGEINKPDSAFFKKVDSEYSKLFPDRWEKMKESLRSKDFANGKLDEESSLFLFSELARLQPITSTGRAQGYHTAGPWIKSLYALRSYWAKQVGILRNQAYNQIKRGEIKDGTARLTSYIMMVAVGQQAFQYAKDKALQRDVPEEEYAIGGLMQMAGIPRYAIFRGKQVGRGTAALETLVPGMGVLNDLGSDIITVGKTMNGVHLKEGNLFENLESTKYAPILGREVYSLLGKGRLKEEKERIKKLEGNPARPTTLQELFNTFDPPASSRE